MQVASINATLQVTYIASKIMYGGNECFMTR